MVRFHLCSERVACAGVPPDVVGHCNCAHRVQCSFWCIFQCCGGGIATDGGAATATTPSSANYVERCKHAADLCVTPFPFLFPLPISLGCTFDFACVCALAFVRFQASLTMPPHRLPTPLNVTLNHLNCTTISENLMVQSMTQRYRSKYVTTVFYSMMPQTRVARQAAEREKVAASG